MSSLINYNGLEVVTPDPTGSGGLAINQNFQKLSTKITTTDPTATDDNTAHFGIGSRWYNSTTTTEWVCTDATTSAAVWNKIAANPFNQSLNTTNSPTFAGATLSGNLDMGSADVTNAAKISASKRITVGVAAISYASSITPNCDNGNVVNVGQLTAAITVNTPSGSPVDGQMMVMRFSQDSTGGRIITWSSAFVFGQIASDDVPTAGSESFEIAFRYYSATSKWRCVGLIGGF